MNYYNNLKENDGIYVIFDSESYEDEINYYFVVRYQLSEEEANTMKNESRVPIVDSLVEMIKVDKYTGIVYHKDGNTLDPSQ